MKSYDEFNISITEVEVLNKKINGTHEDKIIFKSIVLLLCAKIESFVRNSAKEYASCLLNLNIPSKKFPKQFLDSILDVEFKRANKYGANKYASVCKNEAQILSSIWDDDYIINSFNPSLFSSSITANGTNAINDAFSKIGFPDLIKNLTDYKKDDMYSATSYSIKEYINKIVHMRHNIIHENATPNLTSSDIVLFIAISESFVSQINNIFQENIDSFS